MTAVGRRPTLDELLEALHAIGNIEADFDALDPEKETFCVTLTFQRAQCPSDWRDGQPKPSWLIEQLIEELHAWSRQRSREEQWVSKEERMGSSIDTLMAHYTEELKKSAGATPQTLQTRFQTRILTDTILRLKELKERREAGEVYSATESRREKARKAWAEDEYEAPKREEEQRRAHSRANREDYSRAYTERMREAFDAEEEKAHRRGQGSFEDYFRRAFYGSGPFEPPPPKSTSGNKRPWYEILGVTVRATKDEIRKAHRRLAAKFHPDRYKEPDGHARMTEINTARDEGLGGL
jgi:DnaJ-domain-containing protein 1